MLYKQTSSLNATTNAIPDPIAPTDPANKRYIDNGLALKLNSTDTAANSYKLGGIDPSQFIRSDVYQNPTNTINISGSLFISDSATLFLPKPKGGGYFYDSSTTTGYIKIQLPVAWTSTLVSFKVHISTIEIDGTSVGEYNITGYNYRGTSSWNNTSVICLSSKPPFTVRFGYDGTYCCIYIGEATTVWSSPRIIITDVGGAFGGYYDSYPLVGNWAVSVTNILGTITATTIPVLISTSATKLQTARNINGTAFDGTSDITTNAWGTSRSLTLGNTSKSVDGSANVSWSITDIIGYTPVNKAGDTMTGDLVLASDPTVALGAATKQYVDNVYTLQPGNIILGQTSATYNELLNCNGALVSKTTYSALYTAIADTYYYNVVPGGGKPFINQYNINNTTSSPGTWTTKTALPVAKSSGCNFATNGYIYVLGGMSSSSTYVGTVYSAVVNSDGTLGSWTTGTALPANLANSDVVVYKNKTYITGGQTASNTYVATVYSTTINSNGTIGAWTSVSTIPTTVCSHETIVTKNKMYIIGGKNASQLNTIYCCPINTDGSLGTWYLYGYLPMAYSGFRAVIIKDYVYLIGGNNGTVWYNTIYRAPILLDGSIGTFLETSFIPVALSDFQTVVTTNNIFIIGGRSASATYVSTIYSAPINPDGTIGTWTSSGTFPVTISNHVATVTSGYLYIIGGNNTTYLTSVYSTPFTGGLNNYTTYYDGTVETNTSTNFRLPDLNNTVTDGSLNYFIKY
jgi:N-acetylneuraminic acid mutarotase